MRKIALIALIMVLAGTLNIYAANETTINAIVDKTEVKVGETITVSLSANCENGIEGIDSTLEYDETKMELKNLNVDSKFSNMSGKDDSTGEYKITVISNSADTLTSETFATLQFEILDAAQVDEELTVKLSAIEIGDSNDDWVEVADKEVTIKVVEETEEGDNPGTGNNNPSEDDTPGTGSNTPSEDDNPGTGSNKPSEDDNQGTGNNSSTSAGKEDTTTADKAIDYAGLEDFTFVIIAVVSVIAFISYKKYKQYKNI